MQTIKTTDLKKVIIITGASSGIGAFTAKLLARQGHQIVINYSNNDQAALKVLDDILEFGGLATLYKADISQAEEVIKLFDHAISTYGKADVLINNAGILRMSKIEQLSNQDIDQLIDINIKGSLYTMREAAKRLEHGGKIINLSSSVVALNPENYGVYTASKAAIESLTIILAKELRGKNITVNAIAPGPTATKLFLEGKSEELIQKLSMASPLERLGTVEDIANVIDFAVNEQSNWINAQVLRVNGGII